MNDLPIMRRLKDDWVNATQILKCCNFPKAKRTKILEKGVQQGRHEKVQGGFGRFQGTWIPLDDAQKLASLYGVTQDQAPVLFMDTLDPNLIPVKQKSQPTAKDPTPNKRRYTRRVKKPEETPTKKHRLDPSVMPRQAPPSFSPTQMPPQFLPQYQQPHYVLPQQQHQMQPPPGFPYKPQPPPMANMVPPTAQQQEFMRMRAQQQHHQFHHTPQGMPQHSPVVPPQQLPPQQPSQPPIQAHFAPPPPPVQHMPQGPPPGPPRMSQQYQVGPGFDRMLSQLTNGTWQEDVVAATKESDTLILLTDDLKPMMYYPEDSLYLAQLLKFFAEDNAEIPYFIHNPPFDFDINQPIDDEGHTPLHWAALIGNFQMIAILVQKGANVLCVNSFGLNPLLKLISFNNCFELKNFPQVLDLLSKCLSNTDINGRTPLHYLCQFAKVSSKLDLLKYYVSICLDKLLAMLQDNDLVDLLANVVNHQDVNGDTCLHLAAKLGSRELCEIILGHHPRDDLENSQKETLAEIIARYGWVDYTKPPPPPTFFMDDQFVLNTPVAKRHQTPDTQLSDTDIIEKPLDKLENKENQFNGKVVGPAPVTGESTVPLHPTKNQPLVSPGLAMGMLTPAKLPAISELLTPDRKTRHPPLTSTHRPQAPKVQLGKLVGPAMAPLALADLLTMLSGMVGSLADTYAKEMEGLDLKISQLQSQVTAKNKTDRITQVVFTRTLAAGGITDCDMDNLVQGNDKLAAVVKEYSVEVENEMIKLRQKFEVAQAASIALLVDELEKQQVESGDGEDDELMSEEQWLYAQDLSHLQVRRKELMEAVANATQHHGVDVKMYKYRKLISLLCGLKVDDIDGYIDGIEESLQNS